MQDKAGFVQGFDVICTACIKSYASKYFRLSENKAPFSILDNRIWDFPCLSHILSATTGYDAVLVMSGLRKVVSRASAHSRRIGFNQHFFPITQKLRWTLETNNGIWNRGETTQAGDEKSGHINTGPGEGVLFLDSMCYISAVGSSLIIDIDVFPLRLNFLLGIPFLNADKTLPLILKRLQTPVNAAADPVTLTKLAIPKSLPINILAILPRLKEGGAFVKFSHDPLVQASDVEKSLKQYLKENPIKPWFNPFWRVRAAVVHGRPWVEDLHRFPASRLKVEFVPTSPGQALPELSQEELYSFFRKYGKLADIVPQPAESKVVPKYAYLNFMRVRHAIMAKNCMHGYIVPEGEGKVNAGTLLKIGYERKAKSHWIRDWLVNHPRIVIPALLALIATASVAVFDPYISSSSLSFEYG